MFLSVPEEFVNSICYLVREIHAKWPSHIGAYLPHTLKRWVLFVEPTVEAGLSPPVFLDVLRPSFFSHSVSILTPPYQLSPYERGSCDGFVFICGVICYFQSH